MTTTATHDTKRGEDARARLTRAQRTAGRMDRRGGPLESAQRAAHRHRWQFARALGDLRIHAVPDPARGMAAHLPPDRSLTERLQAYAVKAAREGKQETSWLNPHEGYEAALCTFIERILDRSVSAEFLESLENFARRVALLGALNSLSQITLKAMMPGVPDFYQGTEFWDLSLVDPDNRRPVDFVERAAVLKHVEQPDWQALVRDWPNGHIKLAWTRHLLRLRNELADVFADWRLRTARSQRTPSRPCHRVCPPPRPSCRDYGGGAVACAALRAGPCMAARRRLSRASFTSTAIRSRRRQIGCVRVPLAACSSSFRWRR